MTVPYLTGTTVTDTFTSYQIYPALTPALCNAHVLRDLHGVHPPIRPGGFGSRPPPMRLPPATPPAK